MSKVYLVVSENYYGSDVRGVFSTEEKALDFAEMAGTAVNLDVCVIETQLDAPDVERYVELPSNTDDQTESDDDRNINDDDDGSDSEKVEKQSQSRRLWSRHDIMLKADQTIHAKVVKKCVNDVNDHWTLWMAAFSDKYDIRCLTSMAPADLSVDSVVSGSVSRIELVADAKPIMWLNHIEVWYRKE